MGSSLDAIKRVVAAFERSDWTEIDVRSGDVRVHLSTVAGTGATGAAAATGATSDRPCDPPSTAGGDDTDHADVPTDATGPAGDDGALAGVHLVVAPSPGILWRSPEPGAPHFADVGRYVDASATVCIVEVMKLMNHVKAGVGGEVVAVYGRNGVAVDKDEPLFAIAPSEPPS